MVFSLLMGGLGWRMGFCEVDGNLQNINCKLQKFGKISNLPRPSPTPYLSWELSEIK